MRGILRSYVGALLFAFTLVPLIGCARAELPPFDYEKAKQLSSEKHREYDVIFFNEIVVWNLNSNRYGKGINDSYIGRQAEFERMAGDGYLPAYAALRLLDIVRGNELHDPEALAMLLKAAEEGDASVMCALVEIQLKPSLLQGRKRSEISEGMMVKSASIGQGACMGRYGGLLLSGIHLNYPRDIQAAMPLLLESARQGYYVAARALFSVRYQKALIHQFNFSDLSEFKRALCWGRLAEQHTNWAGFDTFIGLLKDYARVNNRPDLLELSSPYDPRRVPITELVVKPETCIQLEQGK